MTNLDPCLAECDTALAEGELLLALLGASGTAESTLAPVRASIATLRREVGRLRGLKIAPARRKSDPFWIKLGDGDLPWPSSGTGLGD